MIQHVSDNPGQRVYNGVLPTGYGKTNTAAGVFDVGRTQGRCNRLLVIVPTDIQREQYARSFADGCAAMGVPLLACRKVDGEASHLRAHRENRAEVFITTVQAILANRGYFNDLMSTGRWMVFCDEYHKLRADAAWGMSTSDLSYDMMLGLTATPVRTDGQATVFGCQPPDVYVSFEDAFKEKAIRKVAAHIEHYFVDVQQPDGKVCRLTTEELGEERSFEAYQKARDLRITAKYLASILSSAHDCLDVKNLRHPGQHQMLVFCMSVAHASVVSAMLNATYGARFSDWMGVGPDGRPDAENDDVMCRYVQNRLPCLVQVDKASEGFDNPRSSVLVFLNLLRKNTVKAIQQAGRGVRRNYGIARFEEDDCHMFASPDTEMAQLITDFAMRSVGMDPVDGGDPGDSRERIEPTFFDIPPFRPDIADVMFDRVDIIVRDAAAVPQAKVDEVKAGLRAEGLAADEEQIRMVIAKMELDRRVRDMEAVENDPSVLRARVDKAVGTLAGNAVRKLFGSSMDKAVVGRAKKNIQTEWIRISGLKTSEMFEEEFARKYEWVQDVNRRIDQSGEVPAWLRP